MPHLDASVLITDDQAGLDFLKSVLDVPADRPAPSWGRTSAVATVKAPALVKPARRRRVGKALVPEAA